ncbi:5,6-dimethylbenzimidazole synthase [Rhodocyclaceae bacterium SMB388]
MPDFSQAERDAVYRVIHSRRDVRREFLPDPIPDRVLARILDAAHHAPSVGFMQPWDFIVIRAEQTRREVRAAFESAHAEAAQMFEGERQAQYRRLKLEGILDAPVGVCVTCDRSRHGPVVIGRTHMPQMDVYSTVCAVQNMWLAARAEGIGMGWVSIFDPLRIRAVLGLPPALELIGWMCMGYVEAFHAKPDLERAGWLRRMPLESVLHFERWRGEPQEGDAALLASVQALRASR